MFGVSGVWVGGKGEGLCYFLVFGVVSFCWFVEAEVSWSWLVSDLYIEASLGGLGGWGRWSAGLVCCINLSQTRRGSGCEGQFGCVW